MVRTRARRGTTGEGLGGDSGMLAAVQSLANTVQQLSQQVSELRRDRGEGPSRNVLGTEAEEDGSPLVEEITHVPMPKHFKVPFIKEYDGNTDPQQHLVMFRTKMTIVGASDAILCKVFPYTLTGSTLTWFMNLPVRSVTSFADLSRKFKTQFAASKIQKKRSSVLFNIQQQPGESLKEFLLRFNEAAIQVKDLNSEVCISALESGLRTGPFSDSLIQNPTYDMDEVRMRAKKFIKTEEVNAMKRKRQGEQDR